MKKLAVILVLCGICSAKKPPNPKDFTMRITVLEPGVLITVRPPCYYALDCATQGTIIQGDNVGTLACPAQSCAELKPGDYMARTVQRVKWPGEVPADEHMRPLVHYDLEVLAIGKNGKPMTSEYWIIWTVYH